MFSVAPVAPRLWWHDIYPHLKEETRLKPGTISTSKGNVTTLVELRQALSAGLKIQTNSERPVANGLTPHFAFG